jgi:hypothetical protein
MGKRTKSAPIRTVRRRSDARLDRKAIYYCWALYKKGWSVPQIARAVWQSRGFLSQSSCQTSIYYAFYSYGFETRTTGKVNSARWKQGRCKRCNCAYDKRTPGCETCRSRHRQRRRNGAEYVVLREPRCVRCGGNYDDCTEGCESCRNRHYERKRKQAA